ncbi:MAG: glutamine-hydrolyzing carbamoyl-phosphate synthase small subunit [Alphaproteobacteria bacterium]|nr:glutamine-hydrolyzing carbamoyl-phosphate synthase small subunit [Alphaproteobacteria bacterium]
MQEQNYQAIRKKINAAIVLADGTVFYGYGLGVKGITVGELCFNTALTGYQEIVTDPSYSGQIIVFTFPHIGNVGTNQEDVESNKSLARGIVVRETVTQPSNYRNQLDFGEWLTSIGITGICGVDTRALTRKIRLSGAQNAAIAFVSEGENIHVEALAQIAKDTPNLKGSELAEGASCSEQYEWYSRTWVDGKGYPKREDDSYHVVVVDYGAKQNILRHLSAVGCRLTVVPARTSAEEILSHHPDGIFLSNGPGDPAATGVYAIPQIKKMIDSGLPIFGICLGHQLLGLTLGAKTEKMFQGHRGANHPVKDLETGKVEITSQNHGFAVTHESLPANVIATHVSLFDNTLQGLRVKDKPIFAVQYHPESSPGPHDSDYLFKRFIDNMQTHRSLELTKKRA